jgi:tRNA A-37 threonylcarbamoyl transferase component Bud32
MVQWHMSAELRRQLLGPHGLPLQDWLRDGIATVVKEGPHRAVYRVRLPGLDFHVKHNRLYGWRGRLRELVRPIKARREFALAAALQARGIPTPQPIAWGTEKPGFRPCASWLITETVADSQTLLNYFEAGLPTLPVAAQIRERRRVARALGALLARLHDAGVVHHDLHPGNLLVRFDESRVPSLWLLDLHTVSIGSPCSRAARRSNLSVFNRYFILRAGRTDRLRFWLAYTGISSHDCRAARRTFVRSVEQKTEQSNLQFWRSRDGRYLQSNRHVERIDTDIMRGYSVRDLDQEVLRPLLIDPDAPFRTADRLLKDSPSSTVVEFELRVGTAVRRVVYKRFRVTKRGEPWASLVRRSEALRSWVFGHAMRDRSLPTPRPLAVWHRLRAGLPHEGYLLTEFVGEAVDLHELARRLGTLPLDAARAKLFQRLHVLARLLRNMHQRGVSHRDLKASNILTAQALGDHRFWFIDLVGLRRHKRVGRRRRVQNLARLNASFLGHALVTRSVRLRFLQSYLRIGLHGSGRWKSLWRAIAAATEAKRAKNAKNGRPLT